jgi:hypothetical protein
MNLVLELLFTDALVGDDGRPTFILAPVVQSDLRANERQLPLLAVPSPERKMDQLLLQLSSVRWDRGTNWDGIAGKYTPKGTFALGGAKENGYQVYAALTDQQSPGFAQVRQGVSGPTLVSVA